MNERTTTTAAGSVAKVSKVARWRCRGFRPIDAVVYGRELAICDVADAFAKRLARRHGKNAEVEACRLWMTSRAISTGMPRYEYEVEIGYETRSGQYVTDTQYICLEYCEGR